ncbi:MAG: PHP domain-containing protein [Saezia sp.]
MKKNEINLDAFLNADLHCHSIYSDGVLTPEDLALRAKENGVALWALTDHDDLSGVSEAAMVAQKLELPFLAGVEISTCFGHESIHVLGLGVDIDCVVLQQGLNEIRQGRYVRAQRIAQALERLGIHEALEGAMQYAGNPNLISRAHFSRFLVRQGICKDNSDAFNRYLGKGKSAYVEHEWVSLKECLAWVHSAGGVAVLAHPGRYRGLSKNQRRNLLTDFCSLGGRGVEVVTGSHSKEDALLYTKMAANYGLLASRGSDFHAPDESYADLGKLPLLNEAVEPVWKALADRIIY